MTDGLGATFVEREAVGRVAALWVVCGSRAAAMLTGDGRPIPETICGNGILPRAAATIVSGVSAH